MPNSGGAAMRDHGGRFLARDSPSPDEPKTAAEERPRTSLCALRTVLIGLGSSDHGSSVEKRPPRCEPRPPFECIRRLASRGYRKAPPPTWRINDRGHHQRTPISDSTNAATTVGGIRVDAFCTPDYPCSPCSSYRQRCRREGGSAYTSASAPTSPSWCVSTRWRTRRGASQGLGDGPTRRPLRVGGAGPLRSPGRPDQRVIDNPSYVPAAWRAIASASPPAVLEPGRRTGTYRRGETTLLTRADGTSRISVEDLAVAVIDEPEKPQRQQALHRRQRVRSHR